ncbi:MAG: hypothetical protein A3I63_02065 [Betaproteobacteria bacterium RIFCSPLOWO2_02_FULL_66_14]|nr:MAG: hypothetical protein A3I63_02065 [Betaproteobacteria bacterium RIFCSPLOWO2_02_FULL_66_14]
MSATLLRRYTGAASAASTPSPRSRRGAASLATASAVACTSATIVCAASRNTAGYAANPLPQPVQPLPGGNGAASGATQRGAITSRQRPRSRSRQA